MSIQMISAPVVEPVTLAELKSHLSLSADDENELISMLIVVARATIERMTGRLLITQSWRLGFDMVPADGLLVLPIAPIQTVSAVIIHDGLGGSTVWPGSSYTLDLVGEPARLLFNDTPPIPGRRLAGVEIDVIAGYGATAASVPAELVQAVKLTAAHWYARRGDDDTSSIPDDVALLVAPYRQPRLIG